MWKIPKRLKHFKFPKQFWYKRELESFFKTENWKSNFIGSTVDVNKFLTSCLDSTNLILLRNFVQHIIFTVYLKIKQFIAPSWSYIRNFIETLKSNYIAIKKVLIFNKSGEILFLACANIQNVSVYHKSFELRRNPMSVDWRVNYFFFWSGTILNFV